MNVQTADTPAVQSAIMQNRDVDQRRIVFFDGVCVMCNGFVTFLAARDRARRLHFAPLQGETFAALKAQRPDLAQIDSMIYQEPAPGRPGQMRVLTLSSAALHAIAALGGVWTTALWLAWFPRFLRDAVYRLVARIRYSVFGKRDETACPLPSAEVAGRLLP